MAKVDSEYKKHEGTNLFLWKLASRIRNTHPVVEPRRLQE